MGERRNGVVDERTDSSLIPPTHTPTPPHTHTPKAVHDVRFLKGASKWEHLPAGGSPEVAFIGRSNVGKSSLINMLLGRRQVARISKTPGKTQEFNYYLVDDRLFFVDLPGYGYAKISQVQRARWAAFIGRYVQERAPLKIVFHLVDSRHEPTALDLDFAALMKGSPALYVILLTKADKLSGNDRIKSKNRVEKLFREAGLEVPVVLTSSEDKRGREEVWTWIEEMAMPAEGLPSGVPSLMDTRKSPPGQEGRVPSG